MEEVDEEIDLDSITAEALQMELDYEETVKCSVVRHRCFNCTFSTDDCDEDADWLVIKDCGCRMPLCDHHKSTYQAHLRACVFPHKGEHVIFGCAWCGKTCKPINSKYEQI